MEDTLTESSNGESLRKLCEFLLEQKREHVRKAQRLIDFMSNSSASIGRALFDVELLKLKLRARKLAGPPRGTYTKRALRRRDGFPVGEPAPCFILCGCGKELDVPVGFDGVLPCVCGFVYDQNGWIVNTGK